MKWLWRRYALMDEVGGDGGAGGGGGVGASAGSEGSDGAAAAGGTATGGSALAAGADASAAPAAAGNLDWLPEKYRVAAADGSVDVAASAQKLAGGYSEISKRLGEGGAPPKASTDYAVTVPDTLKEAVGDLSADPMFTQFRDDMHGLGLTQKQFDGVMSRYFELAPALAKGGAEVSSEMAVNALKQQWKDDGEFKKNVGLSYRAASKIAESAGLSYDDVEKAGLGNNPTFIRLMAAIGPEFSEDAPVEGGMLTSGNDVKSLMADPAYGDPKHPQHAAVMAKVTAAYERMYGKQAVV